MRKNLCKRTVLVQLIIKYVVTCFWNTVQKVRIAQYEPVNAMVMPLAECG